MTWTKDMGLTMTTRTCKDFIVAIRPLFNRRQNFYTFWELWRIQSTQPIVPIYPVGEIESCKGVHHGNRLQMQKKTRKEHEKHIRKSKNSNEQYFISAQCYSSLSTQYRLILCQIAKFHSWTAPQREINRWNCSFSRIRSLKAWKSLWHLVMKPKAQ